MTWPFGDLKRGHYRLILADPPTAFSGGTKGRPQHYPRMTDHEIASLPVSDLAHPDGCFLFLWVTSPKIYRPFGSTTRLTPQEIAKKWGFRYSGRGFVWVKTERSQGTGKPLFVYHDGLHTGTGFTTRKNAEDCLIFRRGSPKRMAADVHEIIFAPVRQHSRKPAEQYDRIERFAAGPYLELFARNSRPNWSSWGNEVGKFGEAA